MADIKEGSRLDAIVDGASKLPVENQESILLTIRGMLFTRKYMMQEHGKKDDGNRDFKS